MAMTERNRRVAVILGTIFVAGGVVCLVCGVFGAFRAQEWAAQIQADAQVTIPQADEFARTHDQAACRDEGLHRSDLCGVTDLSCFTQASVFLDRCLQSCAPTPGFCDGVPAQTEIMASATWAAAQCAQLGRVQDQRCTSMVQAIQRTCARAAR